MNSGKTLTAILWISILWEAYAIGMTIAIVVTYVLDVLQQPGL